MNIKELAEQAGLSEWRYEYAEKEFDHFAELIRHDEREQISHTYLKLTLEAVLREREACAKLCDDLHNCEPEPRPDDCAAAIRQRGEK